MAFKVFNATDGIPATPGSFKTLSEAETFIAKFRCRFESSGYLTSNCERIPASEINLKIELTPSKRSANAS